MIYIHNYKLFINALQIYLLTLISVYRIIEIKKDELD
jgi:hypothetical protein